MGTLTSIPRTLCVLGSLLFMMSLAPAARAPHVGHVFELNGAWLLGKKSPQRLSKGHELPSGGIVYIQSPSANDLIVILDNNGDILARRRCSVAEECRNPIILPTANRPRPSSVGIVFDSVMKLLWGEQEKFIPLRGRGSYLMEAVVLLGDGKVDLYPALGKLPVGDYHLRMREVARGKKEAGAWLGPYALKWDKFAPAALRVAGLRPGLYEVALLNYSDGMYMPAGESAWVLVREAGTFNEAAAAHEEAVALTRKWGDAVTRESAVGFVRAHLSHLSHHGME